MDAGQLHQLGRRLLDLSRTVTTQAGDPPLTAAEAAIIEDVLRHPSSSIGEISARTGFAQSHVSTTAARLSGHGVVELIADPADGRRTRLRVPPAVAERIVARGGRGIEEALAQAVPDPADAVRAARMLDELAALLLPSTRPPGRR